ncbi:hypothetical protein KQ945_10705 [Bacillus subtilis subsp. subtilis]|nr:hypothetical protein [Bacillus subtilis subsp. subtilis]
MSPHLRFAAALCLMWPAASMAQIGPPPNPTATRPVVVPPPPPSPMPVRPVPVDSQSGQVAPMTANRQVQSQLGSHPIQAQGIGPAQPIQGPTLQPKVYDRHGRIIPGAKQVGPNRVLDTRTGKYYDAVPSGDGQQIKP